MTNRTAQSLTGVELLKSPALSLSDSQVLHFSVFFTITSQSSSNGCSGAFSYIPTIATQ